MKILESDHRIITSIFFLFYFTFLSASLPAVELGFNSPIECDSIETLLTSETNHLAFTIYDNILIVGLIQSNNDDTTEINVQYFSVDGQLIQLPMPHNDIWLSPNKDLAAPYFTSNSLFLKNLGFDLDNFPERPEYKILILRQVFEAIFQDSKEAVEWIKTTFSKNDEEAQSILNNSTQQMQCRVISVELTGMDSESIDPPQVDKGRHHLEITPLTLMTCDDAAEDTGQPERSKDISSSFIKAFWDTLTIQAQGLLASLGLCRARYELKKSGILCPAIAEGVAKYKPKCFSTCTKDTVIHAAYEEVIYRLIFQNLVYGSLVNININPHRAYQLSNAASTFIFAIDHGWISGAFAPGDVITRLPAGYALGKIYQKYGLLASTAAHCLWNLSQDHFSTKIITGAAILILIADESLVKGTKGQP